MDYGICIFPTEYSMQPAELGKALEERDFESLWVAEHTHIPCSRESPWPGGADLPQMYYDVYAPLIALAAAAAATTKLKLGTGISLVAQHDPLVLAKEIATLDQISKGRFLFGVGGGWNKEELANHYDFPFNRRWKVMRERIEAIADAKGQIPAWDAHGIVALVEVDRLSVADPRQPDIDTGEQLKGAGLADPAA